MKSIFASAALLFCSLFATAQHIKISETDSLTHIHRIGTTARWVNQSCSKGFALALRSEDDAVFVQLTLLPAADGLVAADDELIFQLENNQTITAHSKGMQVRSAEFNRPVEYRIALEDVKKLYNASILSLGYYNAGGQYTSFGIEATYKNDMQQVCSIFLTEFQKTASNTGNLARLALLGK